MNQKDKEIRILITAVGGGSVGRQIAKALELSPLKTYVVGTDTSEYATGLTGVNKGYVVPRADSDIYIDHVLDICERESIEFLAPGYERELEKIANNRLVFEDRGIKLLINDIDVISTCFNKSSTFKFLKENGLLIPKTWNVNNIDDIRKISTFPVVIKPATQSGGSKNVYIARDIDELKNYVTPLIHQNISIIVQEYVGTSDEEYTVGVLTTPDKGELIGSIALRRVLKSSMSVKLSVANKTGGAPLVISSGCSQGLFASFPEVRDTCEKIALALKSRGPLNIQCRKTKNGVYPFEINPRLSGTTHLRALVGYNEPEMLIRYFVYGEKPEKPEYRHGYVLREYREKFVSESEIISLRKTGSY